MQDKSLIKNIRKGISKRWSQMFSNPYRAVNIGWLKLKYYKHLPPGKPVKHRLFGNWVHFTGAPEFLHGIREIFIDRIYEQELPPHAFIVDCGANIGLSVIYLKNRHPNAKIIAFEPDEANFALLQKNVDSFGFRDVELRNEAVWVANTTLHFRNESSMSSRIDITVNTGTQVKAIRLREVISQPVDFLKMDIEGAEFAVISDLGDKLDLVSNLFIEYHGTFAAAAELTELFAIITQHGFSYYIKEAADIFPTPFRRNRNPAIPFDVQLNIFCFRIPARV